MEYKKVVLESGTLEGILKLTTDFLQANILKDYNTIKIKTMELEDKCVSEIQYGNKS